MDSPNQEDILSDLFRSLVDRYADAIIFADEHQKPLFWNDKAEQTFGLNSEELPSNLQFQQFVTESCDTSTPDRITTELVQIPFDSPANNQQYHRTIEAILIAGKIWHLIRLSELTTFSLTESELYIQSRTDELSQLLNRRGFQSTLEQNIDKRLALAILDIDYFKRINDNHGHAVGDLAIAWFARQLNLEFPDSVCVGRLGGDEFGIVLEVVDEIKTKLRFEKFCETISRQRPDFYPTGISVSIGVAISKLKNTGSRRLLTAGDRAMYQSKQAGRNQSTSVELI